MRRLRFERVSICHSQNCLSTSIVPDNVILAHEMTILHGAAKGGWRLAGAEDDSISAWSAVSPWDPDLHRARRAVCPCIVGN
jgi:hypothetical protein